MPKAIDTIKHQQPPSRPGYRRSVRIAAQERPACATALDQAAECPRCAESMRLWANYYRCPNCGYKESCCF